MRTKSTFSVLIWLDQNKAKNNEALLYARITVNQKRINLSLKRKIETSLWDPNLKKAKGHSSQAKNINQFIAKLNSKLFQIYEDLMYR
tara:strand:- start:879 stop:1142 length:264 start_codon:yes stop_codon:yes gene_type:complete